MATSIEQAFINAGFKPIKEQKNNRQKKVVKCRKCGAKMEPLENINLLVCTGEIKVKDEDGKFVNRPCGNRIILNSNK